MARRLIIRREAEHDASRAAAWYQSNRAGLEEVFLDELERVLRLICETPEAFPLVLGATRRALLRRFPYAVYFRTSEGAVEVVAVFHMRRSPVRWQVRDQWPTYRLANWVASTWQQSSDLHSSPCYRPSSGLRTPRAPLLITCV